MRLIDADALVKDIEEYQKSMVFHGYGERMHFDDMIDFAIDHIEEASTIEAEPIRHSYWIGWEYDGYADGFPVFDSWVCNECGEEFRSEGDPPAFDYCPRCGAKMDGDPGEDP